MTRAFLALGSNLGDRAAALIRAIEFLAAHDGVRVVGVSPVYETDPVGGPVQSDFLNAVVAVDTSLAPLELLAVSQAAEADANRVRAERWGPRSLDVDVLLMDGVQMNDPELSIPHPRLYERAFVLAPLHDLAPHLVSVPKGGWIGVRPAPVILTVPEQ